MKPPIQPVIELPAGIPDGAAREFAENLLAMAQQNPVWLFAAIAILPGFGFPASPLLILAGLIWGNGVEGCAMALAATVINLSWTHLAAAGPAHSLLEKILGKRMKTWSLLGKSNPYRLTTIVRVTPGIPLCVQNYALGLLRVPFPIYITLSTILNGFFVCGFVIAGGSILSGNWMFALGGVAVILAASMIFKSIRHRIGSVPTN